MSDSPILRTRSAQLRANFAAAEFSQPEFEARELLCDALDLEPEQLYWRGNQPLTKVQLERIERYSRRRLNGEPLAYISGTKRFGDLTLAVDRRALIPRPETEELASLVLSWLGETERATPLEILDLGCGSGCLALALKNGCPTAHVAGSDVCDGALCLARQNAKSLALTIEWRCGSWFDPWPNRQFDCIVVNPPYIASGDWERLDRQVREFEPKLALMGGEDGLSAYRLLSQEAGSRLRAGGAMFLEMGFDQADRVAAVFNGAGHRMTVLSDAWEKRRFLKLMS